MSIRLRMIARTQLQLGSQQGWQRVGSGKDPTSTIPKPKSQNLNPYPNPNPYGRENEIHIQTQWVSGLSETQTQTHYSREIAIRPRSDPDSTQIRPKSDPYHKKIKKTWKKIHNIHPSLSLFPHPSHDPINKVKKQQFIVYLKIQLLKVSNKSFLSHWVSKSYDPSRSFNRNYYYQIIHRIQNHLCNISSIAYPLHPIFMIQPTPFCEHRQ